MYVTTFYSFKGGVGRTFSLVNVGVELARTGRKVLMVDFDLEAPGLHTFDALSPIEPHPGVVEYVTEYIATGTSADVRQFVYEKPDLGKDGGRMWIMPAGRGDHEYRQRLASINWQNLYRDRDGYLFFEDMKAQWKESFNPDYVLIDSRTGHTEVEGICTRHLPDAVVILFFPNEQNLCGLRQVVDDIRAESGRSRKDVGPITLHFAMSNVPDLDDEDGILRKRINEFRRILGYDHLTRIHNYPSLALLNQTIFTQARPKSRLAKEYCKLKDRIVDENDKDVEGVVRFLKKFDRMHFVPHGRRVAEVDKRLKSIEEMHSNNAEAMFQLGLVRKGQVRLKDAVALFDRAMELGYETKAVLVERATSTSMSGDHARTEEDLKHLFRLPDLANYEFYQAIQLLDQCSEELLDFVTESSTFRNLETDEKVLVGARMFHKGAIQRSAKVFRAIVDDPSIPEERKAAARSQLVVAHLHLSDFELAMRTICQTRPVPDELGIQDAFNYAMAEWAQSGTIPKDMFSRVVNLDTASPKPPNANFDQCVAVALWAVGDSTQAIERIAKAEGNAQKTRKSEFSCWQYREVPRDEFLHDCQEIRRLITTGEGKPAFFRRSDQESQGTQRTLI